MHLLCAAKKHPLQKSHYFQNNLIFLVNFSEVLVRHFATSIENFSIFALVLQK